MHCVQGRGGIAGCRYAMQVRHLRAAQVISICDFETTQLLMLAPGFRDMEGVAGSDVNLQIMGPATGCS
jgi:hypothetical protein